jgi:2-dehydropantoate 2-reductase
VSAVAVLGPGAVGGALAVRLSAAGGRVVCVGRHDTVERIRAGGLRLLAPDGQVEARPEAVELLRESVSLLVVAVKATALAEALERVEAWSVADGVVVPLLNGLEHPDVIRRRLGPRVAPGSISRFQAALEEPGVVRQWSPSALVTAAPGDLQPRLLDAALEPLRAAGIDVQLADDERAVLWDKAARLAVLAAATAATGRTVGELRQDAKARPRLESAVAEACATAAADGVALHAGDQWAIIDAMPFEATTSTARDLRAGRASELDAITGSVIRAAHRHGVPCPVLEALLADAEAACHG